MYATMGDQCLIKQLDQNKYNHIKLRLLQFLQMLLILKMNKNLRLHLTQATIKCAFLRDKKVILLLLILSGNPNLFLDLKQYHSLDHAETKQLIFLVRYLF